MFIILSINYMSAAILVQKFGFAAAERIRYTNYGLPSYKVWAKRIITDII